VDFLEDLFPPTLGDAQLRVVSPPDGRVVQVRFILKTLMLAKENDYDEVSAPGLNGAPLQFARSHPRTLSVVLWFDGRTTNTDVRQPMNAVQALMNVDRDTHAPPVLSFEWTGFSFRCVLERTSAEFRSSFADGRPSRGRMQVVFKESKTLQELLQESNLE
jgi:hypothetical protein